MCIVEYVYLYANLGTVYRIMDLYPLCFLIYINICVYIYENTYLWSFDICFLCLRLCARYFACPTHFNKIAVR